MKDSTRPKYASGLEGLCHVTYLSFKAEQLRSESSQIVLKKVSRKLGAKPN